MDQTAACDSLFFPAWAFAASPVTQIVLRSQTATSEAVKRKFSQTATVANISHVHTAV